MRFEGKTALVTGGSRGIGRACVQALAADGARVAFVYQSNQHAAEAVVAELSAAGRQVRAFEADVRDAKRALQLVEQLVEEWERLDVLVNSAGIIRDTLFATMGAEQWGEVIDTNLSGTYNYCRGAPRPMMSARRGA
ncbi:MAG: SDR family NAD(P)-dependent oxidoreductase, partial [Pirellulales bacterium]